MFTLILISILTSVFLIFIFSPNRRLKNFPPGPLPLPVIGTILSVGVPPHKGLQNLYKKYGKIYSIFSGNYPGIVLNDLDLIKEAFSDSRFSARPPLRPFLERSWGKAKGLIFGSGPDWEEQRKFSLKVLKNFGKKDTEPILLDEVADLVAELKKHENTLISVNKLFHTAIINALWTSVAGKRFFYGEPELDKLIELTAGVVRFRSLDDSTIFPQILFFQPLFTKLFPQLTGWSDFIKTFEIILPIFKKAIEDHKASYDPNHKRDLIDIYLERILSEKNQHSSFFKDEGERSLLIILLDLFVAGGETASSNLTWGILNLTVHTEVQEKLHEEIDRVIGVNRLPSLEDKKNMPYMEAFVYETLRMATIGALSIMHSTSVEIPNFQGYTLPKDTIVYANFWQVHHDEKLWGDPKNFRPERFLGLESDKVALLNVFSKGKRACPGERLALNELFLFFTGLLKEFKFSRDMSREPPCLDPVLAATLRKHSYPIILTSRNKN